MKITCSEDWLVCKQEFESGRIVISRKPRVIDYESLAERFPKLVKVEHILEDVESNGLPTKAYHDSLDEFISFVSDYPERTSEGINVLVVTADGSRRFYFYVRDDYDVGHMRDRITSAYPEHQITWRISDDPSAGFIRHYSLQHFERKV